MKQTQTNKKGMANPKILGLIAAVIVVVTLLILGLGKSASIISTGAPLETGKFTFAGTEGDYETPHSGCLNGGTFTGINVGTISFCNSIDSSSTLKLSSSLSMESCSPSSGGGTTCLRTNYIQSKIKLPAGKYSINYDYAISDIRNGNGEVVSFTINDFSDSANITNPTGSKTYEFTLTSPKDVTFRIDTTVRSNWDKSSGGSSTGNMQISYTPIPSNCPIAMNSPPCSTAKVTYGANGCPNGWDSSSCILPPNPIPTPNPNPVNVVLSFKDRFNKWINDLLAKLFGGKK